MSTMWIDDQISVSITLSTQPATGTSFGTVLLLVDQASNSLNGDRVRTYTAASQAATAQTAGYISAATKTAIETAFAQPGSRPAAFKVGRVDTAGGEDWSEGYDACVADDPDFYVVTAATRTDAQQLDIAASVEAASRIYIAQVTAADWLTSGVPAAWSGATSYERTGVVYNATSSAWSDVAWAVARSRFDPDVTSAPWTGLISSVSAYSTALTATQIAFLEANNGNHHRPYYTGSGEYVGNGVNLAGRDIFEILTADWYEDRVKTDLATAKVAAAERGEKILMNERGQQVGESILSAWLQKGVDTGHFESDAQTLVTSETISAADIAADRLRYTVRAKIAGSARVFSADIFFSQTDIA